MSKIELNDKNKDNVTKLLNSLFHKVGPYDDDKLKRVLEIISNDLTPKAEQILILRYGLDGSNVSTLDEVSKIFGIGRERVRQIEAKALKKILLHLRENTSIKIEPVQKANITLNSELYDLNLSQKTIVCLKRINVISVEGLLNVKLADLLNIKCLGEKSFQEICDFIRDNIDLLN